MTTIDATRKTWTIAAPQKDGRTITVPVELEHMPDGSWRLTRGSDAQRNRMSSTVPAASVPAVIARLDAAQVS